MADRWSRRRVLVAGAVISLAGCIGDGDDVEEDEDDDVGREGPTVGDIELWQSFPIRLYEAETGDIGPDLHWHEEDDFSHWHRVPVELEPGDKQVYDVVINDGEGDAIPLDDVGLDLTIDAPETDVFDISLEAQELTIAAETEGMDEITFSVEGDADIWTTPPLEIEVG